MKNIACTVVATVEMDASVRTEDGLTLVEVLERDAFRRGAEAMRELAVDACRPEYPDAIRRIRALAIPEDKP
jgi:hypothetical protein